MTSHHLRLYTPPPPADPDTLAFPPRKPALFDQVFAVIQAARARTISPEEATFAVLRLMDGGERKEREVTVLDVYRETVEEGSTTTR